MNLVRRAVKDRSRHDWLPYLYALPVVRMADAAGLDMPQNRKGAFVRTILEYFESPGHSAFTDPAHFRTFANLKTANLMVTGWYDHCSVAAIEFYQHTMEHASAGQKRNTHLVIGPWDHDSVTSPDYDFGEAAARDHQAGEIAFFDRHLKKEPSAALPPVRLFVMGRNAWRDEPGWPLERAVNTQLYLHSGGGVQGAWSRGGLSTARPGNEPPDRFEINLWNTSNEFQPGHRIALAVASSNFPRLSRNLNTGGDNARGAEYVSAEQTVFHDATRPSHLILPVVPAPQDAAARRSPAVDK